MLEPGELIEHASDPAFVIGEGQQVLAFNHAAETLLGYSSEEARQLTCGHLLGAVLPGGIHLCTDQCSVFAEFRACRPYAVSECHVSRKDGSRVPVTISSVALPRKGEADDSRPLAIVFLHTRPSEPQQEAQDDNRLVINTLGRFSVGTCDTPLAIEQWPRKQAIQLLKFLTFHGGRPVHRDRLIEQLWPDADAETGWSRLKVTVHFLRQKFREAGLEEIICTDESAYLLRLDRVQVDALYFEELARTGRKLHRSGQTAEAASIYQRARALYRGDYMEADLYADWCAEERERLLDIYLDVVNALAELHYHAGDFASAAQECHTALVREPCRESVHRLLIQSLMALHRPDRALDQYERCRSILQSELGVEPAAETQAIVQPIARPAAPRHIHP